MMRVSEEIHGLLRNLKETFEKMGESQSRKPQMIDEFNLIELN